jgi:DNA repair exonuclease SbcCD ATPase subunit
MNRIRSQPEDQQDLPLPSSSPMEGIGAELQQRQQELINLQRQQQELEQRKRQLEELNTRRMELIEGQREIRDRLLRAVVILERAEGQGRKEVEQMHETRQVFSEQLSEINDINPSEWAATDIEGELSKALAKVDQAQAIYTQSRAKLDALRGRDLEPETSIDEEGHTRANSSPVDSFSANLQRGLAFNLPLILAILIGLLIFRLLK